MVIEHSFMNKSYTAKIYIYIYIFIYIYIYIYNLRHENDLTPSRITIRLGVKSLSCLRLYIYYDTLGIFVTE